VEQSRGDYTLSDDPARVDAVAVHAYLTRSYWAEGISLELVKRCIAGSLCVGVYHLIAGQVAFARVVTDRASFAYLCDVYVLEEHRGRGLSKWMMEGSRPTRICKGCGGSCWSRRTPTNCIDSSGSPNRLSQSGTWRSPDRGCT
jgi:GNAT superfamily N-acetyltransferase